MNCLMRRLVALTVSLALLGCTSLQPIPMASAPGLGPVQSQARNVAVGSTVTVTTRNGARFELVVSAVDAERLRGQSGGTEREVPLADIRALEQQRIDVLRTSLLVLGVIALRQLGAGVSRMTNPPTP